MTGPRRPRKPTRTAAVLAEAAERASEMRPRVQAALAATLQAADEKIAGGGEIPFSWLGYLGKLLQDERAAAMWDAADDGADAEPKK